ncbi:hypothetical protein HPSA20_0636 [Helicobacter pylori SouthAfrica20]|uniref:Uncharacterized protein n=1 Tax=Helicobacter pylori SouthAfrica20 TaxID=1352356 RepID=T1U9F5_HELPX|nr:hypothetical protein HPSA20_0636 [Helicobacter pylori SouthAfrica20]
MIFYLKFFSCPFFRVETLFKIVPLAWIGSIGNDFGSF